MENKHSYLQTSKAMHITFVSELLKNNIKTNMNNNTHQGLLVTPTITSNTLHVIYVHALCNSQPCDLELFPSLLIKILQGPPNSSSDY